MVRQDFIVRPDKKFVRPIFLLFCGAPHPFTGKHPGEKQTDACEEKRASNRQLAIRSAYLQILL